MQRQLRLTAEQRDNLVAYIDGELDDEAARDIDEVLARNEVARHEVEALVRTGELLDLLPKPTATMAFTERTISLFHVPPVVPLNERPWFVPAVRSGWVGLWLVCLSLTAWLGYQLTSRWIPNPHAELLREFPVVKNLDLYQEVGSIEFLQLLQRSNVFDDSPAALELTAEGEGQ